LARACRPRALHRLTRLPRFDVLYLTYADLCPVPPSSRIVVVAEPSARPGAGREAGTAWKTSAERHHQPVLESARRGL